MEAGCRTGERSHRRIGTNLTLRDETWSYLTGKCACTHDMRIDHPGILQSGLS